MNKSSYQLILLLLLLNSLAIAQCPSSSDFKYHMDTCKSLHPLEGEWIMELELDLPYQERVTKKYPVYSTYSIMKKEDSLFVCASSDYDYNPIKFDFKLYNGKTRVTADLYINSKHYKKEILVDKIDKNFNLYSHLNNEEALLLLNRREHKKSIKRYGLNHLKISCNFTKINTNDISVFKDSSNFGFSCFLLDSASRSFLVSIKLLEGHNSYTQYRLEGNNKYSYVDVHAVDSSLGLAILVSNDSSLKEGWNMPYRFSVHEPFMGDDLYLTGYHYYDQIEQVVSKGILSSFQGRKGNMNHYLICTDGHFDFMGSPVLNSAGEICAFIVDEHYRNKSISFALKNKALFEFLERSNISIDKSYVPVEMPLHERLVAVQQNVFMVRRVITLERN